MVLLAVGNESQQVDPCFEVGQRERQLYVARAVVDRLAVDRLATHVLDQQSVSFGFLAAHFQLQVPFSGHRPDADAAGDLGRRDGDHLRIAECAIEIGLLQPLEGLPVKGRGICKAVADELRAVARAGHAADLLKGDAVG